MAPFDKEHWPIKETHYETGHLSADTFRTLVQRLESTADSNKIEGALGQVFRYEGILGSQNRIIIMDMYEQDGTLLAGIVRFQSSIVGIPIPMPRKLRKIFQEYGVKEDGTSLRY